MAKRIVAKVDTYTAKDGTTKGKYVELGVILLNENGEYGLMHPDINLAGVLMKQRVNLPNTGKGKGDMIIFSIFDNDNQQNGGGQKQDQRSAPAQNQGQPSPHGNFDDFDDDIPF